MIKQLYCYYNYKGCFFKAPFVQDLEPKEITEALGDAFYSYPVEVLQSLSEDHLYYFGTFDTKTGEVKPVKEFVFDISSLAIAVMKNKAEEKKEEEKNA